MKNPILTPIVTEELKHIDKFVQNQKKNAAVKFKGKRRSIEPTKRPPAANYEPDLIVKTFNKCTINADQNTTNNTSPTPEKPVENHTNNHHRQKSPESQVITRKSPEIIIDKETNTNNKPKDNSSNNAVHSFLKRKTCLYNSQYLDSESAVNGNLLSMDDDSGRQTSSSNSIRKSIALEELKQEVVDLVASSEGGVWCTDLLRLYRERHGRELNFGRFGFTSIISLVSVLDSRLALTRPDDTGDWLLRPLQHAQHAPQLAQHAPLPQQAPPARQYRPARTQKTSNNVDPDDALPGIDFDPDVFPVDCMHFMESIPSLSLSAIEPGALLEVMVGEVYSPSHFWLIRLGEQYHIAMEQIMDEMNEYYTSGEGRDRQLALGAVRVGHYCSSLFDRDWHRSLIVKVIDSDTVKVRHVDYGTVDRVSVRALKPLLRSCARLPAMALRARLAGVRPGAAGRRWPHAASTRFLDKVRDTNFVASVVAVDREEDILEVFLVNTSTDVDDDVSADLIRSGHADPRRDSCVRSGECFLFPRFAALEGGATPNYAEICNYLRDGISLDYVDDYRRHVPDCLPPQAPLAAPPSEPDEGVEPDPDPEPEREPTPSPRPVALANRVPLFPASIPSLFSETEAEPERPNRSEPALSNPRSPPPTPPAPPVPPAPRSPSPPRVAGSVTLSARECEMFQYLSRVDPAAAHWFMVGALGRAAPRVLDATAPEFRPQTSSQFRPNVSAAEFGPKTMTQECPPQFPAQSHSNISAPEFRPHAMPSFAPLAFPPAPYSPATRPYAWSPPVQYMPPFGPFAPPPGFLPRFGPG